MNNYKKILLLVPPADKLYIRDYYCSFSSKANYYWPPQDLIILSGALSDRFSVDVIDAMGLGLDRSDCLDLILSKDIDGIIFTTGSATLKHDIKFLESIVEKKPYLKVIASSAIFNFINKDLIRQFSFLDGLLLDFTNNDAVSFFEEDYDSIKNMVFRRGSDIIERKTCLPSTFSVSLPRHELFLNKKCKIPFFKKSFILTITSIGCPYKCSFCCAGSIKHRLREVDNLLEEIEYVYTHLNVFNIFFADPILFSNKERIIKLCELIRARKMNKLKWACNVRADLLDEDLIKLMKKSGCRALLIGAESASEHILSKYNKIINPQTIYKAIKWCGQQGVSSLLYFILGLPGEDRASIEKTARFIKTLKCDFISIDFAMPDFGTELREIAIRDHLCPEENLLDGWDHSGSPYLSGSSIPREDLLRIRKNIYRDFYLRPGRIFRQLKNMGISELVKNGMAILKE